MDLVRISYNTLRHEIGDIMEHFHVKADRKKFSHIKIEQNVIDRIKKAWKDTDPTGAGKVIDDTVKEVHKIRKNHDWDKVTVDEARHMAIIKLEIGILEIPLS